MSNPQKENGYTPIANEIMEAAAKITLSPTGYKILFVVWRQTYGYSRVQAKLSDTYIAKAIGSTRPLVNREINRLIDRNILILYKPGGYTTPREIGFNKDYDLWYKGAIQIDSSIQTDSSIYSVDKGAIQTDTGVLSKQIPKERNIKKYKEIYSHESQEYILADYLLQKIHKNISDYKQPNIQKWALDMDKLLRIDKRDPGEVRTIINFSQNDDFWKTNILSPEKLRKQYDQLKIQHKRLIEKNAKSEQKNSAAVPLGSEVPPKWI